MVDIFAREKAGLKKISGTHLPEVQAIVLWKPVEGYIFIIDPSKQEFSEHIAEVLSSKYQGTLKFIVPPITESVINAIQGKETEYSDYDDPTSKPRDWIDIAVKLAFEINEQEKSMRNITGRSIFLEDADTITSRVFNPIFPSPSLEKKRKDMIADSRWKNTILILPMNTSLATDKKR